MAAIKQRLSATLQSAELPETATWLPASPTADSMPVSKGEQPDPYAWRIVWRNMLFFVYLHYAAIRGFYLMFTGQLYFYTYLWGLFLAIFGTVGVTGGAHRLWSHRCYKATWQLRTLLMVLQTIAFQNSIYVWARDHRGHHKYTDTDADPHNIKRGFFFAHMGWLMIRKHPDVRAKGEKLDLSDLESDPIVMFQDKYYPILMPLLAFVVPAVVPATLWGESFWTAWYTCSMARYALTVHGTWCINSVTHMFGTKPLDRNISPVENAVLGVLGLGEGWHNYHHVFPWDYKAAELGTIGKNFTAAFIDFFARFGWAYDLKTVSKEMIERRARRTGDGSHSSARHGQTDDGYHQHDHHGDVWGWGDKDMSQEDIQGATIRSRGKHSGDSCTEYSLLRGITLV